MTADETPGPSADPEIVDLLVRCDDLSKFRLGLRPLIDDREMTDAEFELFGSATVSEVRAAAAIHAASAALAEAMLRKLDEFEELYEAIFTDGREGMTLGQAAKHLPPDMIARFVGLILEIRLEEGMW